MTRRKKSVRREREEHGLTPETKRDIALVICIAVAAVTALAFIGLVGPVGEYIVRGLGLLFGRAAWLVPLWVFLGGLLMTRRLTDVEDENLNVLHHLNIVGLVVLVFGLAGILHLPLAPEVAVTNLATGGGYLGLLVSAPLRQVVGVWGAAILLGALLVVSFLTTLNTTLPRRIPFGAMLFAVIRSFGSGIGHLWQHWQMRHARAQVENRRTEVLGPQFSSRSIDESEEVDDEAVAESETEADEATDDVIDLPSHTARKRTHRGEWSVPLDLLEPPHGMAAAGDIKASRLIIERTLTSFGIQVEMGEVSVGPTVTQFTCRPAEGVKLSKIAGLSNDLALALAAHPIRIEAPIPGKSLVGIEVPNTRVAVVTLREMMESDGFRNRKGQLVVALGKDVAGNVWVADLARMPHLLIAGATGSGKSVCLHAVITSLLYQHSPDDLRLLLVDPKRVELIGYNGIPHLLAPVITDVKSTINALKWTILEMDRRFDLLSHAGKRNIEEYNRNGRDEPIPYLIFAIDELADLMTVAQAEVEAAIIRLAQMSRAVGIHLILATQRPSVDIITGLIKANITSRIAFSVASATDSRTILDTSGAEKLLGRGDMLYTSAELSKPRRLQGAFVSESEVDRVMRYLKEHAGEVVYNTSVTEKQTTPMSGMGSGRNFESSDDPLLEEAKEMILEAGKASASFLQRRLKVGYARAARLLDLMEAQRFIGPADGAKPREILAGTSFDPTIDNEDSGDVG